MKKLSEKFQNKYPDESFEIISAEYQGIKTCNGVLCWWTDATVDYYEDTAENRKKLIAEFIESKEQAKEIEEEI